MNTISDPGTNNQTRPSGAVWGRDADEPTRTQPGKGHLPRDYFQEDPRLKSPALAMVLSLMPGLGQVYLGYYQNGFINILVVAGIISTLVRGVPGYLQPLLGVFLAFFWLYNLVDAGRRAALYNQALAGLGPADMPPDALSYPGKGSLAGGIALVGIGLLFFAHTRFGMPLEWLEQWWPIGLVLAGVYLLYLSVRDRAKQANS